ncbi:unnamed protein product [Cylicocyclus nassatus]|uniref:Tubulin polyglutamylase TTLL11 n=1 Tax=Cylicocyclus nassatus TaxID=53992 RepID=A0AA36HFV1_CYLNA|nr:unnamed protein product [Cylicocyclus nassatus]
MWRVDGIRQELPQPFGPVMNVQINILNIVSISSGLIVHIMAHIELPRRPSTAASSSLASFMQVLPSITYDTIEAPRPAAHVFTIDTSRCNSNYPVVSLCSKLLGFEEFPQGRDDQVPCDVYWHSTGFPDVKAVPISSRSRVNKFPGMTDLAKKVALTHAISSMQKIFPHDYNFYPQSFFLPAHYEEFKEYWHKTRSRRREKGSQEEQFFIVKPDSGAQGSGIYLISDPSQIKDPSCKQLVQEYVASPFLMKDQLKFDFRVYAVIRSINPLSIYVSREGMARFCTEKYKKPTSENFGNLYAHLTNYSLNKVNDAYVHSNTLHDQVTGSKRLLSTVFSQMTACGIRAKKLWHDVKLIVVKTVLAMLPELMIQYERTFSGMEGPQCFQIVGFDIMVRSDGFPILLEVNACPSLTIDHGGSDTEPRQRSVVDEVIKIPLVRDTLLLVTGQLEDGRVSPPSKSVWRSTDDLSSTKRKAHLSEIFPNRYGRQAASLLFLDRVVYIFMQYASSQDATLVPLSGIKRFVKDCGYEGLFTPGGLEKKFSEICKYYEGNIQSEKGLFFHGFLSFMIYIADRQFSTIPLLKDRLQLLFDAVTNALRSKGVRSRRLRREEFDSNSGEGKKIYLLPSRVRMNKRRSKSCEPLKIAPRSLDRKPDRNNNKENHTVLPRIHKMK